jgi:hypothetical protein
LPTFGGKSVDTIVADQALKMGSNLFKSAKKAIKKRKDKKKAAAAASAA